jgi:transcriptional regulator with XRE-family HTH domain
MTETKEQNVICANITRWREYRCLTREQMADRCNLNASYLARIEAGYVPPPVILRTIAHVLGTTTVELERVGE